jgi:heme-degrading monooxygenase HmoA
MHAVLVRVTINDEESSTKALREQVVPGVARLPGFISGYWTRRGNSGLSLSVFESEDAANSASSEVTGAAPEGVTVDDVEVREVVANA